MGTTKSGDGDDEKDPSETKLEGIKNAVASILSDRDRFFNAAIVLGAGTLAITKLLTIDHDYWHVSYPSALNFFFLVILDHQAWCILNFVCFLLQNLFNLVSFRLRKWLFSTTPFERSNLFFFSKFCQLFPIQLVLAYFISLFLKIQD